MERYEGIAYREDGPGDGPVALLLHGYPESSYMWRGLLASLAQAGWHGIAPDFPGFGDSPADPPGTWERHVQAIELFREGLDLEQVVLVVHDWGGLIGLRWACEHPEAIRALVISSTGFFSDGEWNGLGELLRTPGTGEKLIESMERDGFAGMLKTASAGIDDSAVEEYWKAFTDADRRRGQLELYRSGDFEQLEPYEGRLAALEVPTLLLWGEEDPFAPLAAGKRFEEELPGAELTVLEGAGHFIWEDAPEPTSQAVTSFLSRL